MGYVPPSEVLVSLSISPFDPGVGVVSSCCVVGSLVSDVEVSPSPFASVLVFSEPKSADVPVESGVVADSVLVISAVASSCGVEVISDMIVV